MATVGDPLVDVGTLVNYWPDKSVAGESSKVLFPGLEGVGLISRHELIATYAERSQHDVSMLPWYVAFASWRTTIVLQQLAHRAARGETKDARMVRYGDAIPNMVSVTEHLIDSLGA